jgi:pyruvate/2-oxoglutarate dehydrogenase complex dihydrolipoamide acyltransferase (E2) component
VKKSIVLSAGTAVAASALMALFGTGVAAADDYAGQTYADASSAASDAGLEVIVASRVGDKVSQDDCMVTSSQSAPFIHGDDFVHVSDTILFNLNCNAGYATANTPGPSLASPEGREAKAAADEAAAEQSSEAELAAAGETPGAPGE